MAAPLNDTQLEILKLFHQEQTEEELAEIRSLLVTYLAHKVTREADRAFEERTCSQEIFEQWKKEHFRRSA